MADINITRCRLCFDNNASQIEICNGKLAGFNISLVISQLFKLKITPSSPLPTVICTDCMENVKLFYEFSKRVKQAQREFKKIAALRTISRPSLSEPEKEKTLPRIQKDICIKEESTTTENVLNYDTIVIKQEGTLQLEPIIVQGGLLKNEDRIKGETTEEGLETSDCELEVKNETPDSPGSTGRCGNDSEEEETAATEDRITGLPTEIYKDGKLILSTTLLEKTINKFYILHCDICNDKMAHQTYQQLFEHYKKTHGVDGYVACCGEKLRARKRIISHMTVHLQPLAFQCTICQKTQSSQTSFIAHMKKHVPDSKKQYQCDQCDKGFIYMVLLNAHKEKHIPIDKREKHNCDECNKSFSLSHSLQMHKRNVHSGRTYLCSECGRAFPTKARLDTHMYVHDPYGHNCVQCKLCNFISKSKYALKSHVKRHAERMQCQQCSFSTTTTYKLKKHLSVKHSDEKPHACSVCSKAFKMKSTLDSHMATHTGNRKYACSFCPRTFCDSGNFYVHRKRMHPEQLENIKSAKQQKIDQAIGRIQAAKKLLS